MAGNLSIETCLGLFCGNRHASVNYAVGTDGRVGLGVDESMAAGTSSNKTNDLMAVTIEVANTTAGVNSKSWAVSDAAYKKLILLCADICRRNGMNKVIEISDEMAKIKYSSSSDRVKKMTAYANNYVVPAGTCLLTMHQYFNATACPGAYLISKWKQICADINKELGNPTPAPAPVPTPTPTPTPAPATTKYKGASLYYGQIYYDAVFDPTYYANKYPDLKKAFGTDASKLFNHFLTYGMKEKRQAIANFNVDVYVKSNADLVKAFGTQWEAYYQHYCKYGKSENRKAV